MVDDATRDEHQHRRAMPVAPPVYAPRSRFRRPRILVAGVVAASVGLVVAGGFGVVHAADAFLFHPSDLNPLQGRLEAMPCVTWAEGASEIDSVDIGEVAFEEFGVSSRCTWRQIADAYSVAARFVDKTVLPANGTIEISARPHATPLPAHAAGGIDQTSGAQIVVSPRSDHIPTGSQFLPYVQDWLSVRQTIDPNAQLDGAFGTDDFGSTSDERFIVNTTTAALPSMAAHLSPRLAAAAWRVTFAPVGHPSLTRENSTPGGALTVETNRGLPDALSVKVGRAVDGAWPAKTAGVHQYVSEYRDFEDETTPTVEHEGLDSLWVAVFGVASSQSYSPPYGKEGPYVGPATDPALIPPQRTTAWPAMTQAIDALSTSGHPFGFGIELSSKTFTAGDDYVLTDQNTDFTSGLAGLTSLGCAPIDPMHLSTDANVVEKSLYDYWLSRGRPGLMELPGLTCPA